MFQFFDISSHQPVIDWPTVATSENQGVAIKATQGLWYQNQDYPAQRKGAESIGLCRSYYTYPEPLTGSGRDHALYLLSHLGQLDNEDVLWADAEYGANPGEQDMPPTADLGAFYIDMAQTVYTESGRYLGIYSGNYYLYPHKIVGHAELAFSPLWLAGSTFPPIPKPWTTLTAWQYTWQGTVPGINVPCDLDVFAGDKAAWAALGEEVMTALAELIVAVLVILILVWVLVDLAASALKGDSRIYLAIKIVAVGAAIVLVARAAGLG